jgi:hypothetical protein
VFRAKRIPDPVPMIAGTRFEQASSGNLDNVLTASGLIARLLNFDFDARCSIQSFTVSIKSKKGDVYQANVIGGDFTGEVAKHIKSLQIGDILNFSEIKTRCPGDNFARNAGSLSFIMK